jgi:hypothetical protein
MWISQEGTHDTASARVHLTLVYALLGPLQGLARRRLVLPFHVLIERLAFSCLLQEDKMAYRSFCAGLRGFGVHVSA